MPEHTLKYNSKRIDYQMSNHFGRICFDNYVADIEYHTIMPETMAYYVWHVVNEPAYMMLVKPYHAYLYYNSQEGITIYTTNIPEKPTFYGRFIQLDCDFKFFLPKDSFGLLYDKGEQAILQKKNTTTIYKRMLKLYDKLNDGVEL